MITVFAEIKVKPGRRQAVLQAIIAFTRGAGRGRLWRLCADG